jgi:hypothetical protein
MQSSATSAQSLFQITDSPFKQAHPIRQLRVPLPRGPHVAEGRILGLRLDVHLLAHVIRSFRTDSTPVQPHVSHRIERLMQPPQSSGGPSTARPFGEQSSQR